VHAEPSSFALEGPLAPPLLAMTGLRDQMSNPEAAPKRVAAQPGAVLWCEDELDQYLLFTHSAQVAIRVQEFFREAAGSLAAST
jgi:hypothetical protein